MIIFLYGQDTYRLVQKLNEITERYKKIHKSGLNLRFFDAKIINFQNFKDEFQQTPMFKEKKLIVFKNVFSNKEFKENFLTSAKKFLDSEDVVLLYEKNKIPPTDSLFRFLKKKATFQEFKLLGGERLKNWAKKEFGKYQTKITPDALEKIIDFVGNDLWRLSNEIKKLVNFKGLKGEISRRDIELLVKPKIETDIFKTIDFIASKNKKQALKLLHKHLEKGDSPLYLLSMISFQFRNLLIVRDLIEKKKPFSLILKETNLHPYVVKKSYSQAQKFKIEELKKIYRKIFEVDLNIKTGKLDPQTALDLLIAEI